MTTATASAAAAKWAGGVIAGRCTAAAAPTFGPVKSPPRPGSALGERIAEFLRRFPPFSYLEEDDLRALCDEVTVHYVTPQSTVFTTGEQPLEEFFVVRKGAVQLARDAEGEVWLVDQLDAGDVFGIRPLLAERPYTATARASEESLLYGVPHASFEPLIDSYPAIGRFLATSFASRATAGRPAGRMASARENERAPADPNNRPRTLGGGRQGKQRNDGLLDATRVMTKRHLVSCAPETIIREAAVLMSERNVGSVVVLDAGGKPVGIVTDRELRNRVIAGDVDRESPVTAVMRSPVVTIGPDPRAVDVQLAMVRGRVQHLVVTANGSTRSPAVGVLSQRDIVLALGSSPAAVISEVATARDPGELRGLRERTERWLLTATSRRGSVYELAEIASEVTDAVTRRCLELATVELAARGHHPPDCRYCWLSLGSQGRREQLVRSDQDHAVVFDGDGLRADARRRARAYYVELAAATARSLATIGFEACSGEMMASNPGWCLTPREWDRQLERWISEPTGENLLDASTLLDRRPIAGDLALGERFAAQTRGRVRNERRFLAFLARAAVDNPPPLSFFRSFVVERSGEHKDSFDIKQRAMLPLADAARVLTLELGISDPSNTIQRYERLRAAEPQNDSLFLAAAQAYDALMLFRARQGLADGSAGRYFPISELSKLERLQLRNAFGPIADLLAALRVRFQLNAISQ